MDRPLVSVPEAARFLGLRPSTIRKMILRRRIAYLKLGTRVLLRQSDIQALIKASLVPSLTQAGQSEVLQ
jgi:excisionase family DNA binding protein